MSKEDKLDYFLVEVAEIQEEQFEIVELLEKLLGTVTNGIRGILPDEEFIY